MESAYAYLITSENFHSLVIYDVNELLDLRMSLSQMYGIDLDEVEIKKVIIKEME